MGKNLEREFMLKRVGQTEMEKNHVTPEGAMIRIKDASYPAPFHPGLEFNSPVHGNWNIVHTGMLMPETIQIYVCADNCMRGVVLTAAEMNAADRFSYVIIEEDDLLNGNLEDITIEGVTDVLKKLERKPKAVLLFTVCLHHFLGCDLKMVYEELDRRFPEIAFVRCYMDPIMQKTGLTPDQKLRKAMYDPLKVQKADPHIVTLLGHNFPLDETSDIKRFLKKCGCELREITTCDTWDKYEKLGEANIFLSIYPTAKYGAQTLAKRLGREHVYMPASFDYEEIKQQMEYKFPMRYIMDRETQSPIIVPDSQMADFIAVTATMDEQLVFLDPVEVQLKKGDRVRITGGILKGVEGNLIRIKGDRRVVVSIQGIMAVGSAFIHPSLIEKIG